MMAQIRHTIELLSKILRDSGASYLKAETFRLAKFNRDDAVVPFWNILFEILYFCKYGAMDEVPKKALAELSKVEIVVYVKREMQRYGFVSKDFAALPNDMSSGSRELLLSLGWLMCKENVIDKFMNSRGLNIGEDTYILHQEEYLSGGGDKPLNLMPLPPMKTPADKIKYLLWLNGKLKMKMRQLHALEREKNTLFHKVHEATLGVTAPADRNHLSMLEVYLLRHPDALKKILQLLEEDNERLNNLLLWKDHEDVFWQWMESVLDAKLTDQNMAKLEDGSSGIESDGDLPPFSIPMDDVTSLTDEHDRLQRVILKYEGIIENLEKLVELKSSEITPQELDNLIESIDLEISIQKSNMAKRTVRQDFGIVPTPLMTFTKKSSNKNRQVQAQNNRLVNNLLASADQTSPEKPGLAGQTRGIDGEVDSLHGLIGQLQQDIDANQSEFRADMQKLSQKFNDVICIPPMGKKNI